MPTATAVLYTSSGFIVAADGRVTNSVTNAVINDYVQKIFGVQEEGRVFAYAVTGGVANESGINILDQVHSGVLSLAQRRFRSFYHYSDSFSGNLNEALASAAPFPVQPGEEDAGERETILRVHFIGYFGGHGPRVIVCKFWHHDQTLLEPDITINTPELGFCMLSGPRQASRLFREHDARFQTFLRPPLMRELNTEEAARYAVSYIRALSSPAALEIDPLCVSVGGGIHAAQVTPVAFTWFPGLEPVGSQAGNSPATNS